MFKSYPLPGNNITTTLVPATNIMYPLRSNAKYNTSC